MKKKTGRKPLSFLFALALLVGLVSGMSHVANADSITGYSPIDVTGFNAKTIAASTEADPTLTGVDNNNTYFVAKSLVESVSMDPKYAFPDGTFNTRTGKQFTVKPPNEYNTLQLYSRSKRGTLSFLTGDIKYSKLAILTTGGDSTAYFNVTVNYRNGKSETIYTNAPHWINGDPDLKVYPDLYQISYDGKGIQTSTAGLYETVIDVDPSRAVESLSFTWTGGGRANIFGVSGIVDVSTDNLPATGGYYQLTEDITINTTWDVPNVTTLELNGHKILITENGKLIVDSGCELTIVDSSPDKSGYIEGVIENSGTIINLYTVTYDQNGATGVVPTDSRHYPGGAAVTVLAKTDSMAIAYFTFAGWNTKADGTGSNYVPGDGTSDKFIISENTTLYAQWVHRHTCIDFASEDFKDDNFNPNDYDWHDLWHHKASGTDVYDSNKVYNNPIDYTSIVFKPWTSSDSLPTSGNYCLTGDVTIDSGDYYPKVDGTLNLCLNGHGIILNGHSIVVGSDATLNLYDCNSSGLTNSINLSEWYFSYTVSYDDSPTSPTVQNGGCGTVEVTGGYITGGDRAVTIDGDGKLNISDGTLIGNGGGGVYIYGKNSCFNMCGGEICYNKASTGGGVCIHGGTMNLYGGRIHHNYVSDKGGGIQIDQIETVDYVPDNRKSFKMVGGSIDNNYACNYAAGLQYDRYNVFVDYGDSCEISGGSIVNNQTLDIDAGDNRYSQNESNSVRRGGGVYVNAHAGYNLKISGNPVITGNTIGESICNIYLATEIVELNGSEGEATYQYQATIGVIEPGLSDGASIGVTMEPPGQFTNGWNDVMWEKSIPTGRASETVEVVYFIPSKYFFSDNSDYHVKLDLGDKPTNVPTFGGEGILVKEQHIHWSAVDVDENDLPSGSTIHKDLLRELEFIEWPNGTSCADLESGKYYLTEDLVLDSPWIISNKTIHLCLNGRKILCKNGAYISITQDSTLNIYNCDGKNGGIEKYNDEASVENIVKVDSGGTFTLNGGTISGASYYGVINNGTFTMNNGSITGNGGGVFVYGAMFNMTGGSIVDNVDTAVDNVDTAGVYVMRGDCPASFNMTGGSITGNRTYFGGVYVGTDCTFSMSRTASITGNTATDENCGGVYVFNGSFTMADSATVNGNNNGVLVAGRAKFKLAGSATVSGNKNGDVYLKAGNTDTSTINLDQSWTGTSKKISVIMERPGVFTSDGSFANDTEVRDIFKSKISGYDLTATKDRQAKLSHTHMIDGQSVEFTAWTGADPLPSNENGGNYFLPGDVTLNETFVDKLSGDTRVIHLCLNGHKVQTSENSQIPTAITVESGKSLSICDCGTTGEIKGKTAINNQGTLEVHGGKITGDDGPGISNSGTFTIDGGTVNNCITSSTAISISGNPTIGYIELQGSDAVLNIADKLTYTTPIEIVPYTSSEGQVIRTNAFTSGWCDKMSDTNPAEYFKSCDDAYDVFMTTDKEARLAKPVTYIPPTGNTLTFNGRDRELVTEGKVEAGQGTMQYALGTDASTEPVDGWDEKIPTGRSSGTYYVWYKVLPNDVYGGTDADCVTSTIKSSPGISTPVVTFSVVNGTWDDGLIESKTVNTTRLSSSDIPAVGNKPAEGYMAGSWNKMPNTSTSITGDITYIYTYAEKPLSEIVTEPVAKDLTANGEEQELVAPGEATGGTMQYTVGASDGTYSTAIPKATEAGLYYVWFKAVGDSEHRDTDPKCVEVTIRENSKPAATVTKAPAACDLTETEEPQALVTAGEASDGTMEYALGISKPTSWSASIPTATKAGTYYVWYRAKGDADHSNSKPQSIVVTIKYGENTLVYNGEEQDLVIGGSAEGGTMLYALGTDDVTPPEGTWSETIPTGKDVGTYYVWYKVEGDENHNNVDPVCIKVTIVPDSQVSQFEEGVKTLPTDVTRDDEELVDALRKMYDSLTDDQKKQIPDEDVKKLLDAEKKIEELKGADQGVADGVSNLIDQLPDVENVKEENRTAVEAVAKQYDALTDKQKEMIPKTERDKLEALRKALETNPEDEAVAAQFTSDVDALLGSKAGTTKSLLDAATAILNTMTDKQKALIDPETMALYNEAIEAFKPGRNFRSGNDYFKVLSNGDVTYHHPASTNITDVTVPNQVKKGKFFFKVIKVSNNAFRDCNNLQWAIIGKNVYVLGEKIFYNTPALTKVNVLGNGIVSGKVTDAFLRDGNLTVKVPSDKLDEYKALFIGEGGLNGKVKAA